MMSMTNNFTHPSLVHYFYQPYSSISFKTIHKFDRFSKIYLHTYIYVYINIIFLLYIASDDLTKKGRYIVLSNSYFIGPIHTPQVYTTSYISNSFFLDSLEKCHFWGRSLILSHELIFIHTLYYSIAFNDHI